MPEELRIIPRAGKVPSPTLRDLVAIMFRQKRLVLLSFAAIFVITLVYGLLAPTYEAEMKVLVRRGRVDPVMTAVPNPAAAEFEHNDVTEEELNSEAELLRDHEILRTVARTSGLAAEAKSWFWNVLGDNDEKRATRAARKLGRRLDVEAVRKATLITVTYSSTRPEKAAQVLHCLANAYLERHLAVRRPSGEFGFFEQQVAQSRNALEQSEMQLLDFTRDEGVVSASLERDIVLQKLSEADANDRQTTIAISETGQRIRTLEMKLQALPARTTTQIRNADNPQLLEKMKSRLLELELKRTELLTKYAPTYRLVQEVEQQIAETKASIAGESEDPLRDQTTDVNLTHQWAEGELVKNQVELNALLARSSATRMVLSSYRETAQRLGDRAVKQEELLHNVKAAEEKYLLYVNKREEARIGDALDQGGILNVTIAEQPTAPALPAKSAMFFGLLGLAFAGTASTGLAFAADRLNPAFRTPDEVMICLGAPVLASLPRKAWTE